MKVLIDTHAFLWFAWNDSKLSVKAWDIIANQENDVLLSAASAWELAIKVSQGKLTLTQPFNVFLPRQLSMNTLTLLPITLPHIECVAQLPLFHKDPFDRMIVAQSLTESIPVVSADAVLDNYGIRRIW